MKRLLHAPSPWEFSPSDAYFSTDTDARGWAILDDTFNAAAFAIARAAKNAGQKAYYYRFNAPQTQRYPAYYGASHSADKYVQSDCFVVAARLTYISASAGTCRTVPPR